MKLRWSHTAISDLKAIRAWIAQDRPLAAQSVAAHIKASTTRLISFPLSGREGRVPGTLELVIPGTDYVAAYTVQSDEVRIAAVLHGHQKWPESF